MIRHTFCHLPGIGAKTELELWEAGITDWSQADQAVHRPRMKRLPELIAASEEALAEGDWPFFKRLLGGRHAWRWYPLLRDRAVFVDIETTGGPADQDAVTVIACYDGREPVCFVRDQDLIEFPSYLRQFDLLVTFNGALFDVPYLQTHYGRLRLPPVHLDLRYPLRAAGYRGGLKKIEVETGLAREDGLQGIDGWYAVLLWRRHLEGDARALPTLLRYAAEDVLGLPALAELVYNRLTAPLPLVLPPLTATPRPTVDWPYSLELLWELQAPWE